MGELSSGRFIGERYEVTRILGAGGMGTVYEARDRLLDRRVAIKLAHGSDSEVATKRFLHEARVVASLSSPHIVQVSDVGVEGGTAYIVMELLEGEGLDDLLSRRHLSLAEAATLVRQVAAALETAHRGGVVHRDLKPSNIFLHRSEGGTVVKVLDFGIARLIRLDSDEEALFGTPLYMSPEHLTGGRDIDHRTDLWSLGLIAFEMLTSRNPFGSSTFSDLAAVLGGKLAPSGLGPTVDRFFERALAVDRAARFQSAREMAEALDALVPPSERLASVADWLTVEPSPFEGRLSRAENTTLDPFAELIDVGPITSPGLALESVPAPPPDPWAALADALPRGPLRDNASFVIRLFQALFGGFELEDRGVVRLREPRLGDGVEHPFFAVFMADRDQKLLTRTFESYATPLHEHLRTLEPAVRKVVFAVVDSSDLGTGVREQIFEFHRRYSALVLPVHIGEIRSAVEDDAALEFVRHCLSSFHTFPEVYSVDAGRSGTSFFGMASTVNQLVQALKSGTPFLSVHGPPGSGKSSVVERARQELTRTRFVSVRCIASPERTIAALASEIVRALSGGEDAAREGGVREQITQATKAAQLRARRSGAQCALVLEDADWAIAALVDARTSAEERQGARVLWTALEEQSRLGALSVIVTSLSGFILSDPLLLDWANPIANQVGLVPVKPMTLVDLRRMIVDLGKQIDVTFDDDALDLVYELSNGNVYVARRICDHVVTPLRNAPSLHALQRVRIQRHHVARGANDLAAIGDTFKRAMLPWLGAGDRRVLQVVATKRPRDAREMWKALEGQLSPEECAEALERLRKMGLVTRREGRERLSIPLMEAWARRNLSPSAREEARRRADQIRYAALGISVSALLLGGYWMWSMPRSARWRSASCEYQLNYPSRAPAGAELRLYAFRQCDGPGDPTAVALSARSGTFARLGEDGGPTLMLHDATKTEWRQREIPVTFQEVGQSTFELDVLVSGKPAGAVIVNNDFVARAPGLLKAMLAVAGLIPSMAGMIVAYHREVLTMLRRLFARGAPDDGGSAAG